MASIIGPVTEVAHAVAGLASNAALHAAIGVIDVTNVALTQLLLPAKNNHIDDVQSWQPSPSAHDDDDHRLQEEIESMMRRNSELASDDTQEGHIKKTAPEPTHQQPVAAQPAPRPSPRQAQDDNDIDFVPIRLATILALAVQTFPTLAMLDPAPSLSAGRAYLLDQLAVYPSPLAANVLPSIESITTYSPTLYPPDMVAFGHILTPQLLNAFCITACCAVIFALFVHLSLSFLKRLVFGPATPNYPIQIQDVVVFKGFHPDWRLTPEDWITRSKSWFHVHDDDMRFLYMIIDRSGVGINTHFSPGLACFPPDISLAAARKEAEVVMWYCLDKIFAENNICPQDIDILVTNCSLFNPTPSIASMIISHYGMRSDVQSYNLGGMGCSASPIAVKVASTLLRQHSSKHPLAVVLSMENITQNIYLGKERAFMLANALFRIGGAAILLTRDSVAIGKRPKPKWTIEHLNHVHTAANTDAYTCIFQDIDKENRKGVRLDKSLMSVAANAIAANLSEIGPKLLPIHALVDYVIRLGWQQGQLAWASMLKRPKPKLPMVVPKFKLALQHFCIHAGGRAVLDEIQQTLNLTDADICPSRNVLYRYGNTSSSSIWYEYEEVEHLRHPKQGDRMLSVAVGSGFKANVLVLRRL